MTAWTSCFSIGLAFSLACATQAAPRNKFLTDDGKLTNTLTLKDGQGGFVGTTGSIWTVRPDGSWDRKRFINARIDKPDQQGKLTAEQLQALANVLAHAQIHKLPAQLGKLRGANPHVVTLTWGKRKCVWTLPPGSPMPKYQELPGGKLTPEDGFAEISQFLRSMLKPSKDK